jgi:hypothetical protein
MDDGGMRAPAALFRRAIFLSIIAHSAALAQQEANDEPLHQLIDKRLTPASGVQAGGCSDAEFLRRASLDLIGMPPTADETRAFLADDVPDKRQRLIEKLFASPLYARHLASTFDLMLMERRANTHVSADDWRAWLVNSVRANKPWNIMAREIIEADGDDPAKRAPARFALDRASDPNVLTRDVGRVFFGRDMQCAQCHDHPLVDDYLQSDYQGLLAFISPSYALVRTINGAQMTVQAEGPGADVTFQSVFVGTPRRTKARAPECVMVDDPFYLPGDEYTVAPAANVKPVPKFSKRTILAESATNGSNEAFNRNIVNRLWAHMFGRGLVNPPDMQHPDNPATDPQLLRDLSQRFAAMNFDVRAFLREVALSSAYQRSFDLPPNMLSLTTQAAAEVVNIDQQRATAEGEVTTSEETYTAASETWQAAEAAMLPVAAELDNARAKYTEEKTKRDAAVQAVAAANAAVAAKQAIATPVQSAAAAALAASATLPEDKTLAESAQKMKAKADQLAAELVALNKVVEEKTAAVKPTEDALAAAKTVVEAARAKVEPFMAKMKADEEAMLVARRKHSYTKEMLASLERRKETANEVAKLPNVNKALVAAKEVVASRQAEAATAGKNLSDFAPVVADHEQKVKAASDTIAAATTARDAARAEHEKRTQLSEAITAAFTSADAARQKAPDDAVLAEASTKLQARAELARNQIGDSQKQLDDTSAAYKTADEAFIKSQEALAAALQERARREQAVELAKSGLAAAEAEAATKQSAFDTLAGDLTERWTRDFTVASLKPLTPEQLCWAVFRVTGIYDRYKQTEATELDKAKPMTEEQKKDPAQVAAREVELEQKTFDKLKDNVNTFVAFYGAAAGQPQGDFFATADQALYAANGGGINSWIAPAGDNVTERIVKQEDPKAAADELYLAVLTRRPTEVETNEVITHLANRKDNKPAAAQELVWALINSAEFRFNH